MPERKCQSGRQNCSRTARMGSRCVLHSVRRMVGCRQVYSTAWYKKFEPTLVGALEVRFDMIRSGVHVMKPEEFVATILGKQFQKYLLALTQVVRAIDRKAKHAEDTNRTRPNEGRGTVGSGPAR